jgi:hypothetical protein
MKKFLFLSSLLAFLVMGSVSPQGQDVTSEDSNPSDQDAFPITIDFHCPRNFGFHIGDEIPLTVTLVAREGVVLDLVNLPQKQDAHGPFEVRDMRVRKRQESGRSVYTVLYRLQSFTPAIAVDRVSFPPLRISYATREDWDPMESRYRYRSFFSQPFEIFVSRTATYFGPMKDIKGPMSDKKVTILWKVATMGGGVMALAALITWPLNLIRKRRERRKEPPCPTARDRALKALQEARENCFNYDDHRKRLYFELNAILRNFLKEVFALPTANRPAKEIVSQLKGRPEHEELTDWVSRMNKVIYEGYPPVDVEAMVRQLSLLLQKLDGTTPPGMNHDQTG